MSRVVVVRATGLVTVQDAGRAGSMHQGIPRGGALLPSAYRTANVAVGNEEGAAAIEIMGALELSAEGGTVDVALDTGERRSLAPGDMITVRSEAARRVRYLALSGGVDVPVARGGRGTLLVAALGGHLGRALRRGDVLTLGDPSACAGARALALPALRPPAQAVEDPTPVRVVLGPDDDAFDDASRARFLDAVYVVSAATDRTGTRLEGPALAVRAGPGRRPSAPMVPGAVQIPPDGCPIVLGPDGPTTGGYPLVAVVVRADIERVVAAPIGARVRFVVARALS